MEDNSRSAELPHFLLEKGANCLSLLQRTFDRYWNGEGEDDSFADGHLTTQGAARHAAGASSTIGHADWLHSSGHAIWD
jgi:hypothetical protein